MRLILKIKKMLRRRKKLRAQKPQKKDHCQKFHHLKKKRNQRKIHLLLLQKTKYWTYICGRQLSRCLAH